MGKRARKGGIATAALRAARAAAQKQDGEAAVISQKVYETTAAIKPWLRMPLWMQGPLTFVGQEAAARLCAHRGMVPEEVPYVAAYITSGLLDLAARMVADFDEDHYQQWREGAGEEGHEHAHGDGAAAAHAGARSGELRPAGESGGQAGDRGG